MIPIRPSGNFRSAPAPALDRSDGSAGHTGPEPGTPGSSAQLPASPPGLSPRSALPLSSQTPRPRGGTIGRPGIVEASASAPLGNPVALQQQEQMGMQLQGFSSMFLMKKVGATGGRMARNQPASVSNARDSSGGGGIAQNARAERGRGNPAIPEPSARVDANPGRTASEPGRD